MAQRARKVLVIDAADLRYFKGHDTFADAELVTTTMWKDYYTNGYLPYTWYIPNDLSQTYWLPARCVDCMKRSDTYIKGVTRNKPDDWPPKDE